jgi:hypothetical protein
VSLCRFRGTRTSPSISTKICQKKTERDLFKSANQSTLSLAISTCSGSDRRASLTTTSTALVMPKNRESGKKSMKDWPSRVMGIHMTNSVDG